MARVTLPMGIVGISGKVGNMYFRTRKLTGTVYLCKLPKKRATAISSEEERCRELFKKRSLLVRQMHQYGSLLSRKQLWKIAKEVL